MNYWINNYIIIIAVAILLGAFLIPKILHIAYRLKLYDEANDRKIHVGAVPRLGGISFLPSIGIAFCIGVGVNLRLFGNIMTEEIESSLVSLMYLASALLIIYMLGITDDLVGVRYRSKFLFQILVGVLIAFSGLWIDNLFDFLWIGPVSPVVGWLLTIFLVIYVLNAINLIDGIDGLASGLSIVALGWYSIIFFEVGDYITMLLAGAAIGTLIPFFIYNVFGKVSRQTKIFMGDTGSLTVGLIIVYLTVKVAHIPADTSGCCPNLFILATAPLIIPCFDVVRVFIHRVRKRRNPFLPDKGHIHHKLLAIGLPQGWALVVIMICDIGFIVINYLCSISIEPTWIILGDIVIWTGINLLLTSAIRRREQATGKELYN
ncbi:MAG: undecaprenyl/decaprenyl-phosphate alpha-N-acetylglucosaminyl 1-phosphate transferase [Muribaculaceae bacterium]|nr:undecaprenyl/decaprenyl-phosphate alpha-N-acetylglucosaminyl 1-phosphate transferase [Muribaculaceae bacterium]